MRDVHCHAYLVHSPDNLRAEVGETIISAIGGSTANLVTSVRELRNSLATLVEANHIFYGPEMFRVLLTNQNANFSERLGPCKIISAVYAKEFALMRGNKIVPPEDVPQ
jgi:hypothetical protein